MMCLALLHAIGDVAGSEGMTYNLALALLGYVSSQSKVSSSLVTTLFAIPVCLICDVIFLASGTGGSAPADANSTFIKVVGAFSFLVKLPLAYCLYYALRNDLGVNVGLYGTVGSPTAFDPTPTDGMMQGAADVDPVATKAPTSPVAAAGSYQGYQMA